MQIAAAAAAASRTPLPPFVRPNAAALARSALVQFYSILPPLFPIQPGKQFGNKIGSRGTEAERNKEIKKKRRRTRVIHVIRVNHNNTKLNVGVSVKQSRIFFIHPSAIITLIVNTKKCVVLLH